MMLNQKVKTGFLFLLICFAFASFILFMETEVQASESETLTVSQVVDETVSYYVYEKNKALTDWEEVVALKEADVDLSSGWDFPDWEKESLLGKVLGLGAAGLDPQNYNGENLVFKLSEQKSDGSFVHVQGPLQNALAVMLLEQMNATYDHNMAVEYLLSIQENNGKFESVDATGIFIKALSCYSGDSDEGVQSGIAKAVSFLKNAQLENGGFGTDEASKKHNANSTAYALLGLLAAGEDITDPGWQKNGYTIIDALCSLQRADGSFAYLLESSGGDDLSTRQALWSLAVLVQQGYGEYEVKISPQNGEEPPLPADGSVTVRVEGANGNLLNKAVDYIEGASALDMLISAAGSEQVSVEGGFINAIFGETGKSWECDGEQLTTYWLYYVIREDEIEEDAFNYGADSYLVKPGDEIVFYITAFDSNYESKTFFPKFTINPASPAEGQTVILSIEAWKYVWGEGLKELTLEELQSLGPFTLFIDQKEYASENGIISIPGLPVGEYEYRIENYNDCGYADVVPCMGIIKFYSSSDPGNGGSTSPDKISIYIRVTGKQEQHFSGSVVLPVGASALDALKSTELSYSTRYGGSYVYEIAGEQEDLHSTAGWKYTVNGYEPDVPANNYFLDDGDSVHWFWASDAGAGVGGPTTSSEEKKGEGISEKIPVLSEEKLYEITSAFPEQPAYLHENQKKLPVEIVPDQAVVIGGDEPMSAEEKEVLQEQLENNIVNLSFLVPVLDDFLITDDLGEIILQVDAGSLPEEAEITVEEIAADNLPAAPSHTAVSPVYRLGPQGTVFKKSVTFSIRMAIPGGMDPAGLTVAWLDEEKGQWYALPTVVELSSGYISAPVEHFTPFAVLSRQEEFQPFCDITAEDWAYIPVHYLAARGIVRGVAEGRFQPDRNVTRAEFATMLSNALGLEAGTDLKYSFEDVDPQAWYAAPVKAAAAAGIVKGVSATAFHPNDHITREQMSVMVSRVDSFPETGEGFAVTFTDMDTVSSWAREGVKKAAACELVQGFPDGSFRPRATLTRTQAAAVIYRLLLP